VPRGLCATDTPHCSPTGQRISSWSYALILRDTLSTAASFLPSLSLFSLQTTTQLPSRPRALVHHLFNFLDPPLTNGRTLYLSIVPKQPAVRAQTVFNHEKHGVLGHADYWPKRRCFEAWPLLPCPQAVILANYFNPPLLEALSGLKIGLRITDPQNSLKLNFRRLDNGSRLKNTMHIRGGAQITRVEHA
jgi:hypothetical protein